MGLGGKAVLNVHACIHPITSIFVLPVLDIKQGLLQLTNTLSHGELERGIPGPAGLGLNGILLIGIQWKEGRIAITFQHCA